MPVSFPGIIIYLHFSITASQMPAPDSGVARTARGRGAAVGVGVGGGGGEEEEEAGGRRQETGGGNSG